MLVCKCMGGHIHTHMLHLCRLLKLHTAYFNKDGVLITLPLDCAKRYLKWVLSRLLIIVFNASTKIQG